MQKQIKTHINIMPNDKNRQFKILVVDDDEGILDAISLILEDEGFTIATVSDGNFVIKKVGKFKPDLILLDVLLSGTDGRDISKKLKSDEETQRIPIIMISAHPNAKQTLKKYGANAFLSKPFGADDLLNIINKYIDVAKN